MDEAKAAIGIALQALSRRDHSEWEIRRKLQRKNIPPDLIEKTVGGLFAAGYLDDARFARNYAESSIRNGRGYGFRIRMELLRRGIAEAIIADTLGGLESEYQESSVIRELLEKRFPGFDSGSADDREKRRVLGYFLRRGFPPASVLRVLRGGEGY